MKFLTVYSNLFGTNGFVDMDIMKKIYVQPKKRNFMVEYEKHFLKFVTFIIKNSKYLHIYKHTIFNYYDNVKKTKFYIISWLYITCRWG